MLELLLVDLRHWLQYSVFFGLALIAWKCGDSPEKSIAAVFVAVIFAEIAHPLIWPHDGSSQVSVVHAALDLAMFVALTPIAMRANRIYPLWILAAQLIATVMHFQRGMSSAMDPIAYWALIRLPSYLQMLAFGIGLINHRRRLARGIQGRPWRKT